MKRKNRGRFLLRSFLGLLFLLIAQPTTATKAQEETGDGVIFTVVDQQEAPIEGIRIEQEFFEPAESGMEKLEIAGACETDANGQCSIIFEHLELYNNAIISVVWLSKTGTDLGSESVYWQGGVIWKLLQLNDDGTFGMRSLEGPYDENAPVDEAASGGGLELTATTSALIKDSIRATETAEQENSSLIATATDSSLPTETPITTPNAPLATTTQPQGNPGLIMGGVVLVVVSLLLFFIRKNNRYLGEKMKPLFIWMGNHAAQATMYLLSLLVLVAGLSFAAGAMLAKPAPISEDAVVLENSTLPDTIEESTATARPLNPSETLAEYLVGKWEAKEEFREIEVNITYHFFENGNFLIHTPAYSSEETDFDELSLIFEWEMIDDVRIKVSQNGISKVWTIQRTAEGFIIEDSYYKPALTFTKTGE